MRQTVRSQTKAVRVDWQHFLSRPLSLLLVVIYVAIGGRIGGARSALTILMAMLVPLACVWFPQTMGDYTGPTGIAKPSPASFVWFLGWVVLLLPVIVGTILWLQGVV